jgi:photosystem II stability/assembly factor-like uncharacterized protein
MFRHTKLSADRLVGALDGYLARRRVEALASRAGARAGTPTLPPVPGASNWVQLGPMAIPNGQTYSAARVLVTGRVTAIAINPTAPDNIFIGTAKGGVWKTTDGGGTWSPMSDNEMSLSIGALTLDPTNASVVYAGTGEGNMYYLQSFIDQVQDSYYGAGLLKSIDGGTSWTLLGAAEFTGAAFFRISVHPSNPNTLFVATSHGLYRSTNGGSTWTQMTNGLPAVNPATTSGCTDVAINPSDPNTVFTGFWGSGLYKTSNATAVNPSWTAVGGGLPTAAQRISIGISASNPLRMYVALASHVYASNDGGVTWSALAVTLTNCNFEDYSGNVAVDFTTPDIVYISGYSSMFKLTRNPMTGVWSAVDSALTIHPDHHCFAFHPTNHLTVYAGSDGGIYKSTDGAATWSDAINRGICITQFEFMDQHPTSDVVAFSGTQDNGTEQFRNSPVFYHSDEGDGGFVVIDQADPRNVVHERFNISPLRSTQAGKFGSWSSVTSGLSGSVLFYPPIAMDQTNSNNVSFGGQRIFVDSAQGTGGWPTSVTLPGATGLVSAINFVNSSLMYVGTLRGEIYVLRKSGATWSATAIQAATFPGPPNGRFVWDIATLPADPNTIIVVVSGFGTGHVWRGVVSGATASWTNIGGTGATAVPDVPANAISIDPAVAGTFYVGTDIGVYRTTDSGATWNNFGQGLPNSAVYDLRLHAPSRLLRAVTHGRGMWERKLDTTTSSDVDLFVRDHLMHSGRTPTPEGVAAGFEDPLQFVFLSDPQSHWMCADIKVDALEGSPLSYQMPVSAVDFLNYEARLQHRNAQRGNVNRVYVQVHNRGIRNASGVTVKLHFADASAGLPPLPPDFWTAFPADSVDTTHWHPIGVKTADVSTTIPTVLEWDWTTPIGQATHSCLFVVIDSAQDPIPAANKIFDVDTLVRSEKHVGLKNLHVVDALAAKIGASIIGFATLDLWPLRRVEKPIIELRSLTAKSTMSFYASKDAPKLSGKGITAAKPTTAQLTALRQALGARQVEEFDLTRLYRVDPKTRALAAVVIPQRGFRLALMLTAAASTGRFQVVQTDGKMVFGGSNFVLRGRQSG